MGRGLEKNRGKPIGLTEMRMELEKEAFEIRTEQVSGLGTDRYG